MGEAVIIDAIRTPIGRYAGALKDVRPDDLAALVMRALLDRHPELEPGQIDDVIFGCINQAGEDNRNVARMGLLLAGLPVTVTGVTVNRLCGSGLEAVNQSAYAISSSCRGVTDGIRTRPLRSNHDTRNRHQACVPNHADRRAAGADLDDADARRLDGRCVPHQPRCRRQVERLFDNPVRHRRLAAGESDFHAVLRRRRRGDHTISPGRPHRSYPHAAEQLRVVASGSLRAVVEARTELLENGKSHPSGPRVTYRFTT